MEFNLQLAVEQLADITKPPDKSIGWDQTDWARIAASDPLPEVDGHVLLDEETGLPVGVGSCNTAFCFAGGVAVRSGVRLYWERDNLSDESPPYYTASYVMMQDGTRGPSVSMVAAELLGLRHEDAGWGTDLFGPSNTLHDLHVVVAEYAEIEVIEVYHLVQCELDERCERVGQ